MKVMNFSLKHTSKDMSLTTLTYSACKSIEFGEIIQYKGYYAVQDNIQDHRCRYQSKARRPIRLPIVINSN